MTPLKFIRSLSPTADYNRLTRWRLTQLTVRNVRWYWPTLGVPIQLYVLCTISNLRLCSHLGKLARKGLEIVNRGRRRHNRAHRCIKLCVIWTAFQYSLQVLNIVHVTYATDFEHSQWISERTLRWLRSFVTWTFVMRGNEYGRMCIDIGLPHRKLYGLHHLANRFLLIQASCIRVSAESCQTFITPIFEEKKFF